MQQRHFPRRWSSKPALSPLDSKNKGATNASWDAPTSYVTVNGLSFGLYTDPRDANSSDSCAYSGGTFVTNVKLELIFWGSAWQTAISPSQNDVVGAVGNMINSSYFAGLTQYNYRTINLNGTTNVTSEPPANFSFNDVGNLVWQLIDNDNFPEPTDDGGQIAYMILMPPGATTSIPNAVGSHGAPSDYDFPGGTEYAWAGWSSYGSIDWITNVFSHELTELISDPEPNTPAWLMSRQINGGNEIGDACNNTGDFLDGVFVQAYWSQAQGACVIPFEPPPTVSSLVPSSGSPAGGNQVLIVGTNFDPKGSTVVNWNGLPIPVNCSSSTQCTVTSPPGTGAVNVTVNVNRFTSSASTFSYVPSVTGLSAPSAGVGDTITVHGIGIAWALGNTVSIAFGSSPVTSFTCSPGPDCVVTVPPGSGAVDVRVTVNGTTSAITPADRFTYRAPTVTSVSPSSGPIGGNTLVSLEGSGFISSINGDPSMQVLFGTVPASAYYCDSNTRCVAHSPAVSSAGPVHVTVRVYGGSSVGSAADVFNYGIYPGIDSISWAPGGGSIKLNGLAPVGGSAVALTSDDPTTVAPPATVVVPAGSAWGHFDLTLLPTDQNKTVTLTANYAGSTASTPINVYAWPIVKVELGAQTMSPSTPTTATITLASAAPEGGAVVALMSSDPAALGVPASVIVPAHSHRTVINLSTSYSGTPEYVTLSATYLSGRDAQSLAVPSVPACTPLKCARTACGLIDDGCGNQLCCTGGCRHGQTCTPN